MIIAKNRTHIHLLPEMSNRHGLIAGSTGGGKTITMQVMAENFSKIGVPIFMADIKGDLSGIAFPGTESDKLTARVNTIGLKDFKFEGNPVRHWDPFEYDNSAIKTSISRVGPMLLTRLLDLTPAQEGTLYQIFKIVRDHDIDLIDSLDLTSVINLITEDTKKFEPKYGRLSTQSLGALQRSMILLEDDGNDVLFDGDVFDVNELLKVEDGKGVINILKADRLINSPRMYATLLLWMLGELYETLPEVGDVDKPTMVVFFDEAHLLFTDAPKLVTEKIERLVKLIRSKGVGIFFSTQVPGDIPDGVLSQLANRVQHSMRAFTPKEQSAVKTIAQTFRTNGKLNIEKAIMELKIGEALVSFLDITGTPGIVKRALIAPPRSRMGV